MSERLERIDSRLIYASLLVIVVLALLTHLSTDKTQSLVTVFMIVIIALGNIGYLYGRFKKRVE